MHKQENIHHWTIFFKIFINDPKIQQSYEKKLAKMEEERPDEMEMAAQEHEEKEEKEGKQILIILWL